jgi:tetratricopeptide (TPR) repeat protein
MASVFLSYDRDDAAQARPVASSLDKAGHTVWWDKHIGGGTQYAKEIEQALNSADVVVVLWSASSIESPWVRDEAGSGRDRGRLVPLSLDGTLPPLGFRQFQSIDLGAWRGRGRVPRLREILSAIERQVKDPRIPASSETSPVKRRSGGPSLNTWALIAVGVGMFFVIVGLLIGRPWESGRRSGAPTVSVAATDNTQLSTSIAEGVRANLGSFQESAATNFRLADARSEGRPDFEVTVASTQHGQEFETNVALVSRADKTVLWSKQLRLPAAQRALLGQVIAFAAARPIGCAAEEWALKSGRLSADGRRRYLRACTMLEEADDPRSLISDFRKVIQEAPAFKAAWAHLLMAETSFVNSANSEGEELQRMKADLKRDIMATRQVDPGMPEAMIAEVELGPPTAFLESIALIDRAKASHPDNAIVLDERSSLMGRVGRMSDFVEDARRAAEIEPYSPLYRANYLRALAYSGGIQKAWPEFAKVKQLWPDSPIIADAEYSLNLRFGDFEKAWRASGRPVEGGIQGYFDILRDPSDAKIDAWIKLAKTHQLSGGERQFVYGALPALDRVDQDFQFMDEWPVERDFDRQTYALFRPWFNNLRRDPRFMRLAKRLGLLNYWQKSGNWPDFCDEADLPYECKEEAAKLNS